MVTILFTGANSSDAFSTAPSSSSSSSSFPPAARSYLSVSRAALASQPQQASLTGSSTSRPAPAVPALAKRRLLNSVLCRVKETKKGFGRILRAACPLQKGASEAIKDSVERARTKFKGATNKLAEKGVSKPYK